MKNTSLLLAIAIIYSLLLGNAQAGDHRRDREGHNSKIYGVIETMPENGYEGIWSIGGNEVSADTRTEIKQKHGRVATGRYVEVKGEQIGEKFEAYSIEVEEAGESNSRMSKAKFYGTVEEMPKGGVDGTWRINGRELLVTKNTRIKEKYGKAVVGSYVEVEGNFSGKTFTVYEIEVRDNKHHNSHKAYNIKFSGKIEKMPADGYEGFWVVAGHQVEVSTVTVIDEIDGKASLGDKAKVKGVRSGSSIKAFEIKVSRSNLKVVETMGISYEK